MTDTGKLWDSCVYVVGSTGPEILWESVNSQ